eukprot:310339-Chlamydomonas_euryale.AAC.3
MLRAPRCALGCAAAAAVERRAWAVASAESEAESPRGLGVGAGTVAREKGARALKVATRADPRASVWRIMVAESEAARCLESLSSRRAPDVAVRWRHSFFNGGRRRIRFNSGLSELAVRLNVQLAGPFLRPSPCMPAHAAPWTRQIWRARRTEITRSGLHSGGARVRARAWEARRKVQSAMHACTHAYCHTSERSPGHVYASITLNMDA